MQTNNIVSTPNITGNIGSCTTQEVSVNSGRQSFWKVETTTLATNSCTGDVREFHSYEYTFSAFGVGFAAFLVIMALILAFTSRW